MKARGITELRQMMILALSGAVFLLAASYSTGMVVREAPATVYLTGR